ncbi:hypothetical protein SHK09_15150 [Polaribacter sp. PL03]|uniref:hypothetical protein n=1 Tax=Polaribacter sp. PL03 TaxID=3088353 RepID=UPI0029CBFA16|nr:hypothetical protein [Polaribacter sp. PL03]MDX6748133.1 hypothetical protein [Polaribacter sp. PL03]
MKFLKKNRTKNWIIKLFKLTDQNSAEKFEMESKILFCIEQIEKITGITAKAFDINYQSIYKTKSGFKKALKSNKELVYCFIDFDSKKTETYFSISNQMLNLKEKPEKSTIDFCLQISTEYCNEKSIIEFNRILITELGFDYGYTTQLYSNFDSGTERKMKKGLFSTSVKIIEKDHIWTSNKINILNGAIKNLYPINYLNKSHLSNSEQKKIISEFGNLSEVNNRIYKWNLTDLDIDKLKKTKRTELNLVE